MFYCGTILQTIFPDPETANRLAIGVQALQLAVTLASAMFMDRAGRKPLLILGLETLNRPQASAHLGSLLQGRVLQGHALGYPPSGIHQCLLAHTATLQTLAST